MSRNLLNRIKQGTLFLDGAMGTQLMARGCNPGTCNDYLNIESPEIVSAVHTAYFEAGSDAVITNTFGANAISLSRHGLTDDVEKINTAAAEIARNAAGQDKFVLGGLGPCGDFLEPLGTLKPDHLQSVFAEQAEALDKGPIDGFIIETMTAIEEIIIAVKAIKSVSDLPVFASLAFDPAGDTFRTMMGVSPEDAVKQLSDLNISAIGFNCGTLNMEQYIRLTETYAAALVGTDIILLAEPNAGKPELTDGRAVYNLSPEDFAQAGKKIKSAGARIIGGCCGTTPEHIKALTDILKD